jgi:hypothetical protein
MPTSQFVLLIAGALFTPISAVAHSETGATTSVSKRSTKPARRATEQEDYSCSAMWRTHNAIVKCSTFGGKADVIELADAGGWTHAYQEVTVLVDATYTISGEFYPLAIGECDGSAAVKWCSPSVVVCPGPYNGDYYNTGGCLVGLTPVGKDAWEPFNATFTATGVSTVTVYINQESTTFSSIVADPNVALLHEWVSHAFGCRGATNSVAPSKLCGHKVTVNYLLIWCICSMQLSCHFAIVRLLR